MNSLLTLLMWCVLFVLCWPMAMIALLLWPVVWILTLPLRIVGISLGAAFAFIEALLYLPARILRGPRV